MSSELVFVWDGVAYPHVHADRHMNNVKNILLPKNDREVVNRFKELKRRYMNILSKDINVSNLNVKGAKMTPQEMDMILKELQKMSSSGSMEIEKQLQNELTKEMNYIASQLNITNGSLTDVKQSLYSTARKGDNGQQQFFDALDMLIEAIDGEVGHFKNKGDAISNWKLIHKTKNVPKFLDSNQISFAQRVEALLGNAKEKAGGNFQIKNGTINSLLTDFSEYAAGAIQYVQSQGNKEAVDAMIKILNEQAQFGQQLVKQNIKFTGAKNNSEAKTLRGYKGKISKAADSSNRTHVTTNVKMNVNGKDVTVTATYELDHAITTKEYIGQSDSLKLVSFSGQNSVLLQQLREVFNFNTENKYAIYNGLAFSFTGYGDSRTPRENYRIIRTNLIAKNAEKYIVGLTKSEGQRTLVYNGYAYPLLGIISAIAEQGIEAVKNSREYGSIVSNNDLFAIKIEYSDADKTANKWLGPETNSLAQSKIRIKKVYDAIGKLKTYGQLNRKALDARDPVILKALNDSPKIKLNI